MAVSPLVSVIIPTYNRAKFITEAIDSVLTQAFQNFEIIIIDDGSTDDTRKILLTYLREKPDKIRYIYQENRGPAAARNTGIKAARGRYIAFLDSDDLWLPRKLETQISVMEQDSSLGFTCSQVYHIYDGTSHLEPELSSPNLPFKEFLLYDKPLIFTPTVIVRKECFNKVGTFDEQLKTAEDTHMWLRLADMYRWRIILDPLAIVRRHGSNLIYNKLLARQCEAKMYKRLRLIAHDSPEIRKIIRKKYILSLYSLAENYRWSHRYKQAFLTYLYVILHDPLLGFRFKKVKKLYIKCLASGGLWLIT